MEISTKFSKLANDMAGVEATLGLNANNLKRSVYTLDEINALPQETKVYRSVGTQITFILYYLGANSPYCRENVRENKTQLPL